MNNGESNSDFIKQINAKIEYYEDRINSGIFLNVNNERDISEIFGVLDYLKEKFKRWNNRNIFNYSGDLFKDESILVIGAADEEEAKIIIITVYLKILIKEQKIQFTSKYKSITELELFLQGEITKNLKNGYPDDRLFEKELRDHLNKIIEE
ncbi:MAG: hypothetical protein KGD73_01955 [Candidatus Lokiarchaeota archaeon]|nr:hypothetical protein [Candidatus Lokiarchaeota archaeon]